MRCHECRCHGATCFHHSAPLPSAAQQIVQYARPGAHPAFFFCRNGREGSQCYPRNRSPDWPNGGVVRAAISRKRKGTRCAAAAASNCRRPCVCRCKASNSGRSGSSPAPCAPPRITSTSTTSRSGRSAADACDSLDSCRATRQHVASHCSGRILSIVAINIRNAKVERLADELADMAGESRTATILHALEERREKIARGPARKPQLAHVLAFLEKEIWPNIPKNLLGRRLTKTERERVLGFGKRGV